MASNVMDRLPLVTVILPAYNAQKFIAEAIASVIGQTYQNWELIIINDGSNDDTEHIVLSFSDARIRYFSKGNGGVSSARNLGFSQMSGDYFCFLDADDVLPPRSIEARLVRFSEEPELQFVDGVVQVFDDTLTQQLRTYKPELHGNPLQDLLTLRSTCFFGVSWMVRRIRRHYRMEEDIHHGEDLFLFLTLARDGGIYGFTTEEVLYYRRHSTSAMRNILGLHQGYKAIYHRLKEWPEFGLAKRIIFSFKVRKSIFLAYISIREYSRAFSVLFS